MGDYSPVANADQYNLQGKNFLTNISQEVDLIAAETLFGPKLPLGLSVVKKGTGGIGDV